VGTGRPPSRALTSAILLITIVILYFIARFIIPLFT
jgi:hypothetical protein